MQRRYSDRSPVTRNLFLLMFSMAVVIVEPGCRQPESKPAADPAASSQEDQRSVFRQAIDQAKSLEKRINDRAIDPGEKGRIDETDPTGQKD